MLTTIVLFILGLMAGSFVNALVWRLHENNKKLTIFSGRSVCPHCRHELAWYDLIPLVSWLLLRAKCRYCKKPISTQYPVVELIAGLVFAGSYSLWPGGVYGIGDWLLLITWLLCSVGLLALAVYDFLWMMLPNKIIYPTLAIAVTGRIAYIAVFEASPGRAIWLWALSVAVASGVFYILFTISKGKWIGYGDVRLGWITGTILAHPSKSLAMIFLASVIGVLVALPDLLRGKKTMASRIPFGPFLILATVVMVLWGNTLLDRYQGLLGL